MWCTRENGHTNLGNVRAEFESTIPIVVVTLDKALEERKVLKTLIGHIIQHKTV
jgi:hypothetical protein